MIAFNHNWESPTSFHRWLKGNGLPWNLIYWQLDLRKGF